MPGLLVVGLQNVDPGESLRDTWLWLQEVGACVALTSATGLTPSIARSQIYIGLSPGQTGEFDSCYPEAYTVVQGTRPGLARAVPTLFDRWQASGVATSIYTRVDAAPSVDQIIEQAQRQCEFFAVDSSDAVAASASALDHRLRTLFGAGWSVAVLAVGEQLPVTCQVNVNALLYERGALRIKGELHSTAAVDWSDTLAYQMGHGQVWVNLRGREPNGIVTPGEEYDQVRRAIAQLLMSWVDPDTHRPVVEAVYQKEDIYSGPHMVHASDMLVRLRPGYAFSEHSLMMRLDRSSLQPAQPGLTTWNPSGWLAMAGQAVQPGIEASADLLDVSPTLAYLLQEPIPGQWQGRVIEAAIRPGWLRQQPSRDMVDDELSAEDEAALVARLQALGYLS